MFRFCKVANFMSRNIRPAAYFNEANPLVTKYIYYNQGIRFYGKKSGDDSKNKDLPDFCKAPPPPLLSKSSKECEKIKPIPPLQECAKPNLMSDCPRPACPYTDPCKKESKALLWFSLLALAATAGALYYYLSQKKPPKAPTLPSHTSKKLKRPLEVKKCPKCSKDIPREVPYLIIGGGTAAFSAFRAIKSNDPSARVLIISNEDQYPYMRPPLSKELWFGNNTLNPSKTLNFQCWNGTSRSLYYEPHDFYVDPKDLLISEKGGVAVARGWTVTHLDVLEKKAYLDDGYEISYEKCLIATGSLPKNLDIFENAPKPVIDRVSIFRTVYDYQCIADKMCDAGSIAIIGGGFLGSELACAFAKFAKSRNSFKVYQIFKEPGNMAGILPQYLSCWTTEKIKAQGVEVLSKSEVVGVSATSDDVTLTLSSGKTVTADLVVVAVGAEPNTELAYKSGLETCPINGGYLVNSELLARTGVYVAGDAACFYDPRLGRRRIEHHDNAVISGRLAGENMTGADKSYVHQSMFWSDLGPDIGYEAIGIVNSSLPTVGIFAKTKPPVLEDCPMEEDMPEECIKYISKEEEEKQKKLKEKREMLKRAFEEKKKEIEKRNKCSEVKPDNDDYCRGVIFYLKDDIVVGIVLWNVFNRMSIARQVLKDKRKYADLNEVGKLFNIHEHE